MHHFAIGDIIRCVGKLLGWDDTDTAVFTIWSVLNHIESCQHWVTSWNLSCHLSWGNKTNKSPSREHVSSSPKHLRSSDTNKCHDVCFMCPLWPPFCQVGFKHHKDYAAYVWAKSDHSTQVIKEKGMLSLKSTQTICLVCELTLKTLLWQAPVSAVCSPVFVLLPGDFSRRGFA